MSFVHSSFSHCERCWFSARGAKTQISLDSASQRRAHEDVTMEASSKDEGSDAKGVVLLTCAKAAESGNLEVLKWARSSGCAWDESTCSAAAKGGHLTLLRWAKENGCPSDATTCAAAAGGGHLEVLMWARENDFAWDESTCASAAAGGHRGVLKWARANECPWNAATCASAAESGNLEVLKWARANKCPWDATTCANAAEGGHFDLLRWARVNGCPWDEATQAEARSKDWFDAIDRACYALPFLPRDVLPFILCEENLPDPADLASLRSVSLAMRLAVDGSGRSVKEMDQSQAARRGCLAALKRIRTTAMLAPDHSPYSPLNKRQNGSWKGFLAIALEAAGHGQLEVLKWANLVGKEDVESIHDDLMFHAAKGGHLETLKWMCGLNWPWGKHLCEWAAEGGHVPVLKWLRENDCPWDDETCAAAAKGGHLEVLKWARANGCPWDAKTRNIAADLGYVEP